LKSIERASINAAAAFELGDVRIGGMSREWLAPDTLHVHQLAGFQPDDGTTTGVPGFQTAHEFPNQFPIPVL
jgi:hypothetical protein